jgi:hypothetical protein
MLRVHFKQGVKEAQIKGLLSAIAPTPYTDPSGHGFEGGRYFAVDYHADVLDVISVPPNDLPAEVVDHVTLKEYVARFFRADGQYRHGTSRITAEVYRLNGAAGAPVQNVSVTGPSVREVVAAFRAFRKADTPTDVLVQLENWGNNGIGSW